MWSLRSFSVRFLWSEVVWWGLPCGSWSCWSASSRCWGEDRTPPPRSAQRFRFPLPGRRSGRQAPPRRSSDEAEKIKKKTHDIESHQEIVVFFSCSLIICSPQRQKQKRGVWGFCTCSMEGMELQELESASYFSPLSRTVPCSSAPPITNRKPSNRRETALL